MLVRCTNGRSSRSADPARWRRARIPILGSSHCARRRQKPPLRRQHRLKAASGAAWARIVATQLFDQFLVAVHDALPALYARLRREAVSALAGPFKRTTLESVAYVWLEPSHVDESERATGPSRLKRSDG